MKISTSNEIIVYARVADQSLSRSGKGKGTYIMILTSGDRKTTFELKNERNLAAEETRIQGQVTIDRIAQRTWPRMMLEKP